MKMFFSSLPLVLTTGFVGAFLVLVSYVLWGPYYLPSMIEALLLWGHIMSGIMWIGLLWYFNFVQIPNMVAIPPEQKPAISKIIAPAALFWFRYGALFTLLFGLLLAAWEGHDMLTDTLTLGAYMGFENMGHVLLGIGMWGGIVMAFNVWFVIWPNQRIALNLPGSYPFMFFAGDKASAPARAMMFSRLNTLLSIPVVFIMVVSENLF